MRRTHIGLLLSSILIAATPALAQRHGDSDDQGRHQRHVGSQSPVQSQVQTQHVERRARPHVEQRRLPEGLQTYSGPRDYRTGRRPRDLERRMDGRFDHDGYRHNYRSDRRYHHGRYNRPYGWYMRNWVFGDILPSLFWNRNYWILDYWNYGLPVPPPGYVWVRYGEDALLIDRRSGQVLEVVYDIFW